MLLDKVVLPITTTFSEASLAAICGSDRNKEACVIASGKEIGSSQIIGQFNLLAKSFTSETE